MSSPAPFPLQWPPHVPRTAVRRPDRFKASRQLGRCRDEVRRELLKLRATAIVISTNIPVRRDGDFYVDAKLAVPDCGAAVYFHHPTKGPMVFACDRWSNLAANLWSVAKTVEALRGIARWGTGEMVASAFSGYRALPGPGESTEGAMSWWVVLGVRRDAPVDEVERAARALSAAFHTDRPTGDAARFAAVREALAQARAERGAVVA